MTEPDIPVDDAPPWQNGHAKGARPKIDPDQIGAAINRAHPEPFKVGATILLDAEALEMETIDWLWLHWLALGKLHLIAGAPEAGKTTIALALAATISAGAYWPDGTRAPAGNVLIWTSEDGLADTIKPRLVRMDADLSRVKFVYQQRGPDGKIRPFNPATDMACLTAAVAKIKGGVALLMIDPVVAAIGTKTNSHNNAETRNSLQPVVDFAEAANCAVLGISHFTKGTGGKDPIERVTGSLAFGALPRIVFAAAKNENGESPRIFVRAKSNIGPSGGGFGFDIDAAPLMERFLRAFRAIVPFFDYERRF
jgi:putative DNA primase/helicase